MFTTDCRPQASSRGHQLTGSSIASGRFLRNTWHIFFDWPAGPPLPPPWPPPLPPLDMLLREAHGKEGEKSLLGVWRWLRDWQLIKPGTLAKRFLAFFQSPGCQARSQTVHGLRAWTVPCGYTPACLLDLLLVRWYTAPLSPRFAMHVFGIGLAGALLVGGSDGFVSSFTGGMQPHHHHHHQHKHSSLTDRQVCS